MKACLVEKRVQLIVLKFSGDVTFQEGPTTPTGQASGGDDDPSKIGATSAVLSKTVFHHNLVVAFVLRGELEKADGLLERLCGDAAAAAGGNHVAPHFVMLRAYVALARGDTRKCRDIIKNNCNIVVKGGGAVPMSTNNPPPPQQASSYQQAKRGPNAPSHHQGGKKMLKK